MKKVQEQLLEYRRTRQTSPPIEQQRRPMQKAQKWGDDEKRLDVPIIMALMKNGGQEQRRRNATTAHQQQSADDDAVSVANEQPNNNNRPNAFPELLTAFDLFDIYPLRKWREFCAHKPLQCWTLTASLWLAGQLLAAHVQFGFVYFVLSALMLLVLNLGVRREGELSAYSVFNPNCERLPGQLTGEHFERDMLFARRH